MVLTLILFCCVLSDVAYQFYYNFLLSLGFFAPLRAVFTKQMKDIMFEKDSKGILNFEDNLNLFSWVIVGCSLVLPLLIYHVAFPLLQSLFEITNPTHLWVIVNLLGLATQYNSLCVIFLSGNLFAFVQWFINTSQAFLIYNILFASYAKTNSFLALVLVALYQTHLIRTVIRNYRNDLEALDEAESTAQSKRD